LAAVGDVASGSGIAPRAASALQPHVGDDGMRIQVLGQLPLTAALAAAVAQNGAASGHWLSEADELAGRIPDDPASSWHSFCKTNVGVWRVGLAVLSAAKAGRAS
jgi:hypothetical protein